MVANVPVRKTADVPRASADLDVKQVTFFECWQCSTVKLSAISSLYEMLVNQDALLSSTCSNFSLFCYCLQIPG